MFESLSGKISLPENGVAVVQTGGVAFRCSVSANTMQKLSAISEGTVYVFLHVREDALELFGFFDTSERRCFLQLTGVSGVGPKAALAILSVLTPDGLAAAVSGNNVKAITAANGVGPKLAQRIILELKDKVGGGSVELDFSGPAVTAVPQKSNSLAMANAALQELGYSPAEITTALKGADPNASTEELIRHALRAMVMRN